MKDFVENPTCSLKFDVMLDSDGNIVQPGETAAGKKSVTFSGIKSNTTIEEIINTENSPAIHNGIAGLMWLLSGTDENFDTMVEKITSEVVENE